MPSEQDENVKPRKIERNDANNQRYLISSQQPFDTQINVSIWGAYPFQNVSDFDF